MTTRTRRLLRGHLTALFKPAARYPADPRAVFILALSVFSGLTALALGAAPRTFDDLLPDWGIAVWGGLLTAGSAITLVGMAFQNVNGILAEQVGSVWVGVATVFYSVLAISVAGWGALQVVGIVFAWGIACFVRWIQLQALIADGEARAIESEIVRRVKVGVDEAMEDQA